MTIEPAFTIEERRTPEARLDRWNDAQARFMREQDEDAKETMLEAFVVLYRTLANGSSVGLEEELDRLERKADEVIRQRKIREGIPA